MSNVLAVQLSEDEATFVTARVESGRPIVLLGLNRVPLALTPAAAEDGAEPPPPPEEPELILPNVEIDSTLGVLESDKLLYSFLELPFKDPRKIEQVATFQIQDSLPFDLEDFVIDSIVTGSTDESRYRILASMVPKGEVARSLSFCTALGAEPRVITTGAASLAALGTHCHPESEGLRAYIEITNRRLSLAVLLGTEPVHLRDVSLRDGATAETAHPPLPPEIVRNVACSLKRVERELEKSISEIHVIAFSELTEQLRAALPYPIAALDLSRIVVNDAPEEIDLEEISWSLGLVATELQRPRRGERRLLDFRQGPFAFHRAWQDMWSALQQEMFYIALAVLLGLIWFGGKVYANRSALGRVEDRISEIVAQGLPGEAVPYGSEVGTVQSKLDTLEDDLRGLGSLTSLSPLEALQELTLALGTGIDVSLDSLSISSSRLLLRGTVAENRQVADLSAALKARTQHFCDVKVDNKGKTTRVGFTAEITLCE